MVFSGCKGTTISKAFNFVTFVYHVCVYVCAYAVACVQTSEDSLWESVLTFCCVGPKDWTQVSRLGGWCHFVGPSKVPKRQCQPRMMAHACNPSTLEARGSKFILYHVAGLRLDPPPQKKPIITTTQKDNIHLLLPTVAHFTPTSCEWPVCF